MIESILGTENMAKAYHHVMRNKGAGGVDRMELIDLGEHLRVTWERTTMEIRACKYLPQAIKGVTIPKSSGKMRLLGIPTVGDRLIQQGIYQILMPIFDAGFQKHSYGFRPNRNAHQAVNQSLQNINEGYQDIVDIDLKRFFDEVDHELLLTLIHSKVTCKQTLCLIRRFLRAPILLNEVLSKRRKGVPQGGPLSPLLSNILLNELDIELERRGHKYVRYADDFSIYVKSKIAARRVGNGIFQFLRDKLRLPLNRDKSGIRRPNTFKVLGYGFVPIYKKGVRGKYQLVVDKKAIARLKSNIKTITRKASPLSFDERIKRLNDLRRGWVNYFRLASVYSKLKDVDEWTRTRLRSCIWHDWKKPDRKRKNLIRLGVPDGQAYAWSRTRMGRWAVACSPILRTTITLQRLEKRGYQSFLQSYKTVTHG